jgi:hypothetical protein
MRLTTTPLILAINLALAPPTNAEDLTYVPNSTKRVCQLTGDFDHAAGAKTLSQTAARFGVLGTDLGSSFEHKGKLYFLFGDTVGRPDARDALAWTQSNSPEKIVLDFYKAKDGKWLPLTVPGISQKDFEVPSGGISIAGVIYVVCTTDHSAKKVMGRSVLASSHDDGQTFKKLYDLSRDKFINVSLVLADGWLYIYGSGEYRKSSVCVARIKPADIGDPSKLRYFTGLGKDGQPQWSAKEADAVVLFRHDVVGEFSVAYLEPVQRYVMLYNASEPRGITMRSAPHPWVPWSDGTIVFEPTRDRGYGQFMHKSVWQAPFPTTSAKAARAGSPLAAVTRLEGALDAFWIAPEGTITTNWANPKIDQAKWQPAFPVAPKAARADSPLAVVTRLEGALDTFWIKPDGAIATAWANPQIDQAKWQPAFPISPAGAARAGSALAAVTRLEGALDVFWIGPDGAVMTTWSNPKIDKAKWHDPFPISPPGAARAGSTLAVVTRLEGALDAFWIGPDGAIVATWANPGVKGGKWHDPFPISKPKAARADSPLAVVTRLDGALDVFWLGPGGAVQTTWANPKIDDSKWHDPFPISGTKAARAGSAVAAVTRPGGALMVFWIGTDGAIATTRADPAVDKGAWRDPLSISPPQAARSDSPLTAVSRLEGLVDVFWIEPGGALTTAWRAVKTDSLSDPNREDEWGGEYGPYIMSRFTTKVDGRCRIYYTMSTWNPYQVMVMRSDLLLKKAPE